MAKVGSMVYLKIWTFVDTSIKLSTVGTFWNFDTTGLAAA
jgi:hypothetical protein